MQNRLAAMQNRLAAMAIILGCAFRTDGPSKGTFIFATPRSPKVTQIGIGASFEGFKITIFTIRQLKSRTHFETDFGTGMNDVVCAMIHSATRHMQVTACKT